MSEMEWLSLRLDPFENVLPTIDYSTFFDELHTSSGKEKLHAWFRGNLTKRGRHECASETLCTLFLRQYTNLPDNEIFRLLDVFDMREDGYITFEEFHILISLLAAICGNCRAEFLYLHGTVLANRLCAPQVPGELDISHAHQLGSLCAVPQSDVWNALDACDRKLDGGLTKEDLLAIMHTCAAEVDRRQSRTQPRALHPGPRKCCCVQ
eukprot:Rmarinus@m.22233